ncbi:SAM-dependent methyltransferase [Kitasatospora purpeofusca]|uniref:SAM-dependent methyltransferase n=1 Tax=Kitasatospora purpeofusca TaxID=67352 RepID=UPI0036C5B06E
MTATAASAAHREHSPWPQHWKADPEHLDRLLEQASYARVRDFLRGGSDANDASVRVAWDLISLLPAAPRTAQDGDWFAAHAVAVLVRDHGVRQIVHADCGLPRVPGHNTHDIARAIAAGCRVLYTDADPVAVAHARCLLEHTDTVAVADTGLAEGLRRLLRHPAATALLDPAEPLAVVCAALETVPDSVATGLAGALAALWPAGGHLAVCQPTTEAAHLARQVDELMTGVLEGRWGRLRTPAEFTALLRDTVLVEPPRVVSSPRHVHCPPRPTGPARTAVLGAIARTEPAGRSHHTAPGVTR